MSSSDQKRRRGEWCRHFTGIQNKTCKEGIAYESVRDESARPYQFPCILNGGGGTCEKLSPYTQEELDAREQEFKKRLEGTMKARAAIVAQGNRSGTIDCPVCEAKQALQYSVASNGHVWAGCKTDGCVRWASPDHPNMAHIAAFNPTLVIKMLAVVEAAKSADIVMDTAALHGIKDILAPAYADGWARAHMDLQRALREMEASE